VAASDVQDGYVLVLNTGSSSVKYQLFDMSDRSVAAAGLVERIGEGDVPDHKAGIQLALDGIRDRGVNLDDIELAGVGHRVVHGGNEFREPVLIDDDVVATIHQLIPLAPLHNPANLTGIEVAREVLPDVPQVAVFDTAFHATLPPHAYTYALPTDLAERLMIRRYGFHGTSHDYVSRCAAQLLDRPLEGLRMIVLHLGNGASAAAIDRGRSVDTTMGLTPLQGLVMGTRSGDIDPAVVFHMHRVGELSYDEIDTVLNRMSGLKGLCGDNDLREVTRRADSGDDAARLALDVYCYRIKLYIGAYFAALGSLDAVVFTAGVGENSPRVRAQSLRGLDRLGVTVDQQRNEERSRDARVVSPDGADVAVLVVPTNEELEIANQTLAVVRSE
jgi:acetate kinase